MEPIAPPSATIKYLVIGIAPLLLLSKTLLPLVRGVSEPSKQKPRPFGIRHVSIWLYLFRGIRYLRGEKPEQITPIGRNPRRSHLLPLGSGLGRTPTPVTTSLFYVRPGMSIRQKL